MDALNGKNVSDADREFALAEKKLHLRTVPVALKGYRKAETLGYDPDACAGARWLCYMLQGEYKRAWGESEAIERRGKLDRNRFWNGEPLEGARVMVRCLHGLGDTLQYVRYLPILRERGSRIVLEAQPALKRLLAQSNLADEVITWGEPEPAWDTQIEVVELPRIFRTTLDSIPKQIPYLQVPAAKVPMRKGRLHVGVVWTAGAYNHNRSIPFDLISRIFLTPGCEFFSLQAGGERDQLAEREDLILDLHRPEACVLDTASKLINLDLLMTVDTMMAHLGGALGMPVWTLLPFEADWRWMLQRDDSPWYPTMRLFRQLKPDNWERVVDRLRTELTAAAARVV